MRGLGLTVSCVAVWLLLSGIYDNTLILILGVVSCALVVYVAHRMALFDDDDPPLSLVLKFLLYLPWLCKEILLANIDVTRRILKPSLPISPRLFQVKTSQRGDLAKTIYANSITLTPGTLSVWLHDDEIEVHALSQQGVDDLLAGEMDRRVSALEAR